MTTETPTQPVTQVAVAKAAGVTPQTVWRVINNPGQVAAATREKVNAAIVDLGYTGEEQTRGGVSYPVAMVKQFQVRVDADTAAELARRGALLLAAGEGKKRRGRPGPNPGWDVEVVRLALDWAFRPPEGVAPMPDDYQGAVKRIPA